MTANSWEGFAELVPDDIGNAILALARDEVVADFRELYRDRLTGML